MLSFACSSAQVSTALEICQYVCRQYRGQSVWSQQLVLFILSDY